MVTDNEEDDDDFEEGGKKEGRRRTRGAGDKDRPLPPLLARVSGQIEVQCSVDSLSASLDGLFKLRPPQNKEPFLAAAYNVQCSQI